MKDDKAKISLKKDKAIYVRVSTDAQIEGYSIEAQIELVSAYLKSKECTEYKTYIDPGFSGKNLERPAIKELIKDIKNNKIETVLVFKLDRLSRSQKDTLYMIEEVFNKYNVGFISIRESFDTTTPFGKAMIGILSVFAQLERETILERTRIGLKKRAEDGYWRGGGNAPFAYDYDQSLGILVPNDERKMIFRLLLSMRLKGASYNELASVTGVDAATIRNLLTCRTNLGLIPYKGEEYDGRHEAVITEEEYAELMKINENKARFQRASHYLLSGKIYCGYCGAKYRYQKWGKRTVCYCYSQQKSKPQTIKDPNCKNIRLDSFEIEDNFLEQLFAMSLDEKKFNQNLSLANADLKEEYTSRLERINNKIDNLLNFVSNGIAVDDINKKIKELIKEREDVKKKLEIEVNKDEKKAYFKKISNLSSVWNQMEFKEQRNIVESLLDKIVIDNNKLKIYWKIS